MTRALDSIRCPLCDEVVGGEETLVCQDSTGSTRRYRRCSPCGAYVMDPLPIDEELASFYDDAYYGAGDTKFPSAVDAVRNLMLRRRAVRSRAWLSHRVGRVLDVGCGDGRYLNHMRALGFEIHGTELPGPAFDRAVKLTGAPLHAGPLRADVFEPASFDIVTLWHVLEHLIDPRETLENCRTLIKSDGILVVEVPNVDSWQSRLGGARAFNLDPPRHICQFNERALYSMFRRLGFEVIKRETFSLEMGVMGAMQTLLNHVVAPRDLLYDLVRSRFRCAGSQGAKAASLVGGLVLLAPAMAFTLLEACAGRGPVLRLVCRLT